MKNIFQTLICISVFISNCYANEIKYTNKITSISSQNKLITIENQIIKEYKLAQNDYELAEKFAVLFLKVIQENPESLNYSFTKLQEETDIRIETSSDKKLRFYSWDNNTGGTMRFFDQIIQFTDKGKINSKLKIASDDAQSFISKIYSIKTNKNETFYFTINNAIYSTSWVSQSIFAYKIANGKLNSTSVFKTKKKMLSSIQCEFDFFSVVDRPERPVELIKIKTNILYIPLINEKGVVTSKNLIYKWDGNNFIYEGIK